MKAAKLFPNHVIFTDVCEPSITQPDDVKVKIHYASICGYDLMMYLGAASPDARNVVGHEASGVVTAIGSEVRGIVEGSRITIRLFHPCGLCDNCRKNKAIYCQNVKGNTGQMREYIVVHQRDIFSLGENLSMREGCLIEPLSMAMRCLERAQINSSDNVLILGGGAMGLMILKLARLYPAGKIAVAEPVEKKRNMALRFGADAVFDPTDQQFFSEVDQFSKGLGCDVVIEASGDQGSAKNAFYFVGRGGRLVYYGLYGMGFELPLNLFSLYWKDVTVNAVYPSVSNYAEAIDLAPRLHLEDLITAEYPFEKVDEAFKDKASGQHAKVMLRFF